MASGGSSLKQEVQDYRCFTLKILQDFHSIDRNLYRRLILQLGLDPYSSKRIVAFWCMLERIGLRYFVKHTNKAPRTLLIKLVREAITCLHFLYRPSVPSDSDISIGDLSFTCVLFGLLDDVPLRVYVCMNRDRLVMEIDKFLSDLSDKIFEDIDVELLIRSKEEETKKKTQASTNVSQIDRTLFVTFSKGRPISREQLFEFFNREYGLNCVEAIYMSSQQPSETCLYARVVVRSTSYVAAILGKLEIVQFTVYGKDIRVRRFVSKHVEQHQTAAA
ncbi:hypothetical protein ACOSP7_016503 [Xanthoceras sorbifolium]|uniref:Uncharacterized protein n=1 Tax=Xanthoceras sorbifolium TaxID=99658 RepID=A0ABQ8HIX3_9ROSI|nr:hypothetical protein JRO89_XS10G0152100 [Xanthoceras sorbifolium]